MEYKAIYKDDYISHYGVMGMRWGHRKDGGPQGYLGTYRTGSGNGGRNLLDDISDNVDSIATTGGRALEDKQIELQRKVEDEAEKIQRAREDMLDANNPQAQAWRQFGRLIEDGKKFITRTFEDGGRMLSRALQDVQKEVNKGMNMLKSTPIITTSTTIQGGVGRGSTSVTTTSEKYLDGRTKTTTKKNR